MTAYEESVNLPVDPDAIDPEPATPWEVTFRGGFWGSEGTPGREIPIGKHFLWGSESWYIPAAYLCDEGLVLDFCLEADPEEVNAFIQKWDLLHEERHSYTARQREQMALENPLHTASPYPNTPCTEYTQRLLFAFSCAVFSEYCVLSAIPS